MQTRIELTLTPRRMAWVTLLVLAAVLWVGQAVAGAQENAGSDDPFWDNTTCYVCHQQSGFSVELPSNETLNLAVFEGDYDVSVHGLQGVSCRNCHQDITGFPHPELTAATLAQFTEQLAGSCEVCHRDHYTKVADELHAGVGGLACSNCHDPHATGTATSVAEEVQPACSACHSEGKSIPTDGIHAAPEVPERETTSVATVFLILGGAILGFVFLVWLATVAWRVVRDRD